MPGDTPRICWDACVLISYIEARADRLPVIEEMFSRAEKGEIELVTSVVSRVEVAYAGDDEAGRDESEGDIAQLWTPHSPITAVELYDSIADAARGLIRRAKDRDRRLTPLDAIHVATAMEIADELQSYDTQLHGFSGDAGIPIHEPRNPQERLESAAE